MRHSRDQLPLLLLGVLNLGCGCEDVPLGQGVLLLPVVEPAEHLAHFVKHVLALVLVF